MTSVKSEPQNLPEITKPLSDVNYPDPKFCSKTSLIQLGYGIWINLNSIGSGLVYGFSAVAIPQMNTQYQNLPPLNVTENDGSWITSLPILVASVGALICGPILDSVGRRNGIVISQIPSSIGWLCMSLATNKNTIFIGRILNGIGVGMLMLIPRIFTSEITLPNMRGVTGVIPPLAIAIGITIQASVGMILHWHHLCYMSLTYCLLLIIANSLLSETYYYKLMKGEIEEALTSLRRYRSRSYQVELEMNDLIEFKIKNDIRRLTLREKLKALRSPAVCKPLLIISIYVVIAELSGITVFAFYGVSIMESANTSINPYIGHIVLSCTGICGCITGGVCVYKFKRKSLAVISALGVGLTLIVLGVFIVAYNAPSIMPVLCGVIFIMFSSIGHMPLPLLIMSEYCPLQIRGIVNSFVLILKCVCIFTVTKYYPSIRDALSFHNTVMIMGIISILGSVFLYFFIPNTNDLTLAEIEEYLHKRRPSLIPNRGYRKAQYEASTNLSISQLNIEKRKSLGYTKENQKNIEHSVTDIASVPKKDSLNQLQLSPKIKASPSVMNIKNLEAINEENLGNVDAVPQSSDREKDEIDSKKKTSKSSLKKTRNDEGSKDTSKKEESGHEKDKSDENSSKKA